jgi:hypothetical protein
MVSDVRPLNSVLATRAALRGEDPSEAQAAEAAARKIVELKTKPEFAIGQYKDSMQALLEGHRARRIQQTADFEIEVGKVEEFYKSEEAEQLRKADEADELARKMRELYTATVANREVAIKRMRSEQAVQDAIQDKIIRSHEAMLSVLRED